MSAIVAVLRIVGLGIGSLIVLILIEMISAVFAPWVKTFRLPMESPGEPEKSKPPKYRENVQFEVAGTIVKGWLYLPEKSFHPRVCVVMSTGFGGTKDMMLENYARRFHDRGMAVLTYDYRHFGESGGEPRQLFDTSLQLDDLRAAIGYARSRKEIDPNRIVLWGTSAAGGYGLVIAAEDKDIACVIGLCPSLDRHADLKQQITENGLWSFLRLFVHAQRDKGRSRLGMKPHRIPIVGKPGVPAFHNGQEAFEGYVRLGAPQSLNFRNDVCARVLATEDKHNPINYAAKVECPALLIICENDKMVSPTAYKTVVNRMGRLARVSLFPIGHFDIHNGEWFDRNIAEQIAFLQKECAHDKKRT